MEKKRRSIVGGEKSDQYLLQNGYSNTNINKIRKSACLELIWIGLANFMLSGYIPWDMAWSTGTIKVGLVTCG